MAETSFVPILFGDKMSIDPNDIIGKKFNMLTVQKYEGCYVLSDRKKHFYKCKCECGKSTKVNRGNLKSLHTKSCGCLLHLKGKNNKGWKGFKGISGQYWSHIKEGAKSRNLEFTITMEEIWNMYESQNGRCVLTDLPINLPRHKSNGLRHTASLDRINNTIGYVYGNIQWIHKDINRSKSKISQDRFIELCLLVTKNNSTPDSIGEEK